MFPSKVLLVLIYVQFCLYVSPAYAVENIDGTPCGKGYELSAECYDFTRNLDGEELYDISTKIYWQYVGRLHPENMEEINIFRNRLLDESAAKDYVPAILDRAFKYKSHGRLALAEEYFNKAANLGDKAHKLDVLEIRQARKVRIVSIIVIAAVLLALNAPLMLKRSWQALFRRTLVLLPYYIIFLYAIWYSSAGSSGRLVHPLMHRLFYWLDIQVLFVSSPVIMAAAYYYLLSNHLVSKKLALLNIAVFVAVCAAILMLGYALSGTVSQGAGK